MPQDPSAYLLSLFGLTQKTALITGGSRGIGRNLTISLAQAGASVIIVARDPQAHHVQYTQSQVQLLGGTCHVIKADLSSRADVLSIVPTCKQRGWSVDIVVHCAGLQHRAPATDFPLDEWDSILRVNLDAGFILSREFAKEWFDGDLKDFASSLVVDTSEGMNTNSPAATRPGSHLRKKILFIASMTTFVGSTSIPAYTASKGAVGQLTKALSNEWAGRGINVNAIAPGYIATELTQDLRSGPQTAAIDARIPMGRWGVPEDLEAAVVYLCSRAAAYVSGEVHCVDGGFMGR
jgi:2-deoxy-D-gluconate 3-dehydrogenase